MIHNLLRRLLVPPRPAPTLSSLDAYARWAATYPPHAHNALMQAEQAAMLALLPPLQNTAVLDLACGTGRYGLIARERGARIVLGMDNSPAMLEASPLAARALATTEQIPLADGCLDVVICALALGHLPRLAPSIAEIARVLKPGGIALVSDFHPFMALNGHQRTFNAGGQTFAVEHYVHLYSDTLAAAAAAGLGMTHVVEPRLREAGDAPVVIVYRLQKADRR